MDSVANQPGNFAFEPPVLFCNFLNASKGLHAKAFAIQVTHDISLWVKDVCPSESSRQIKTSDSLIPGSSASLSDSSDASDIFAEHSLREHGWRW